MNIPRVNISILAALISAAPYYVAPTAAAAENGFAANAAVTVQRIRIGRHQGMTRIVLDTSGPIDFDYQISDGGKALVLMLPKVVWKARDYIRMGRDRAIYRIGFMPNRSTGGGVLSILGRRKLALARVEVLKPWRHWGHRVALDLPHAATGNRLRAVGVVRDGRIGRPHAGRTPVMQYGVDGMPQTARRPRNRNAELAAQPK